MPQPAYAKILVSVNGGAPQTGGVTVNFGDVVQFTGESTDGWEHQRWDLLYYPLGFATPAGWTLEESTGFLYSTAVVPPPITMPPDTTWGKWMPRLRVNDGLTNAKADQRFTDRSTGLTIPSPVYGLKDFASFESNQFDLDYVRDQQDNLRVIEGNLGGAGGGGPPTGPAGGHLGGNYPNPTTLKLNGATVPAAGGLTAGHVLQVTGAAALTYALVALTSLAQSSAITGQVPTWSGSAWVAATPAVSPTGIAQNGATEGQALIWHGSAWGPSTNFSAQNLQTTGTLSAGATTVTALTVSGLGAGVVHSSSGGAFSSSLIVNGDIGDSTISAVKLAGGGTTNRVALTVDGTHVLMDQVDLSTGMVKGTLPPGNLPTMGTDVTGAINANTVVKLTGSSGVVDARRTTIAWTQTTALGTDTFLKYQPQEAVPAWHEGSSEFANTGTSRKNQVWGFGWNLKPGWAERVTPGEAATGWTFQSHYQPGAGATAIMSSQLYFVSGANDPRTAIAFSYNLTSSVLNAVITGDTVDIGYTAGAQQMVRFQPGAAANGAGAMTLGGGSTATSAYILAAYNNAPFLYQQSSSGASIELLRLDSTNRVVLASAGLNVVRTGGSFQVGDLTAGGFVSATASTGQLTVSATIPTTGIAAGGTNQVFANLGAGNLWTSDPVIGSTLQVRTGATKTIIGSTSAGSASPGIYFGNIVPDGVTNWALLGNGTTLTSVNAVNSSGDVTLSTAGIARVSVGVGHLRLNPDAAFTIGHLQQNGDVPPVALTIRGQDPSGTALGATNRSSGPVIIDIPAPLSTGTSGVFKVTMATAEAFAVNSTTKYTMFSGPTWTTGGTAPSASEPEGSKFSRTDASNGDLYVRRAGAWVSLLTSFALAAQTITAGAGLTGTGTLASPITIDVVAADASIVVNPNSIAVGVISAAQHGNLAGGSLHAAVTGSAAGFAPQITAGDRALLSNGAGTSSAWSQIANAHISSTADIAVSKLAGGLPGQWLTSDASSVATWAALPVVSNAQAGIAPLISAANRVLLSVNGTSSGWGQVNLSTMTTGSLTLAGDVTGNHGSNTVVGLTGTTNIVAMHASVLRWDSAVGSPLITQNAASAGVPGTLMIVIAQDGGTGNCAGGHLALSGGVGTGTAAYGSVFLYGGGAPRLEVATTYVALRNTSAPSTTPSAEGYLWEQGGRFRHRGTNGLTTTIASEGPGTAGAKSFEDVKHGYGITADATDVDALVFDMVAEYGSAGFQAYVITVLAKGYDTGDGTLVAFKRTIAIGFAGIALQEFGDVSETGLTGGKVTTGPITTEAMTVVPSGASLTALRVTLSGAAGKTYQWFVTAWISVSSPP